MKTPGDVLSFWFGVPARTSDELKEKMKRWFSGGPEVDAEVRRQFLPAIDAAIDGKLDAWLAEPKGWLALLILLDQLARNAFRGDARTHAGDARALRLTEDALAKGTLRALPPEERHFAMMPLLHAEDLAHQARFAEEHDAFFETVPEAFRPIYAAGGAQSKKYIDIIRRFGRFPHRNAILGRPSTPEEIEFLSAPRE